MLTVDLGEIEYFDDELNEFVYEHGGVVRFEYSLKAIYEWEAKWKKPFLKGELTYTEMTDFYRLMALDDFDMKFMNENTSKIITEYILATNTATTFSDPPSKSAPSGKGKIHTSEEIYAMMFASGVDLEFENRNFNRLMVILKIISIQNNPNPKMNKQEVLKQNSNLNRQRRAQMKTKG